MNVIKRNILSVVILLMFSQAYPQICYPDWQIAQGLQNTMYVYAKCMLDGQYSINPNDMVGAFVGDECRGIASPGANGLVVLSIGSNVISGETVKFKIWNSVKCESCDAMPELQFDNGTTLGTEESPYEVSCCRQLNFQFGQGYTWLSVNVNPGSMNPNTVFINLSPATNDRIIGQSVFSSFSGVSWIGSLTLLDAKKMYKLKITENRNITIKGLAVENSPLTINAGYTWLGYLPQQCLSINTALSGLSPQPQSNDRIIGQSSFSVYNGTQWIGGLTQLCPGKGYIIKLTNNSILNYPKLPAVTSNDAGDITFSTASSGGEVTSNGGINLTARGVVWSIVPNPTLEHNAGYTLDGSGTGVFTSAITGLNQNTTYYVRAYATNILGTTYGEQIHFTTPGQYDGQPCPGHETFTDSRDNTTYQTVRVGSQCWLKENLKYLPAVNMPGTGSNTLPFYYVYGYNGMDVNVAKNTTPYNTYGVLYNWTAAMNESAGSTSNPSEVQGACPSGWHLPSDAEWKQMEAYLGMTTDDLNGQNMRGTDEGAKLSGNNSLWQSGVLTASSSFGKSGFTALPGGSKTAGGIFSNIGYEVNFWTTSDFTTNGWYRYIYLNSEQVGRNYTAKSNGFSVRCILNAACTDAPGQPTSGTHTSSQSQIVWNWNTVSGASGYKYNTSNDYQTATDNGNNISFTQTDLPCETSKTLYVWAYNDCGASAVISFTQSTSVCGTQCNPAAITDSRDGNVYNTVQIGNQCWLKENLKYLPSVAGPATGSNTTPYYYVYGYDGTNTSVARSMANYNTYGVLYNWTAVMQTGSNAICPAEWHVPNETECTTLENYLISGGFNYDGSLTTDKIAKSMSVSQGWSASIVSGAVGNTDFPLKRNATGFSAFPGGIRHNSGVFNELYNSGVFWTSTEHSTTNAKGNALSYNNIQLIDVVSVKESGYSVRCIKDVYCTQPPITPTSGTHTPSQTQIIWNWNTVSGATGYKYNTVNNYSTATDNNTGTSFTQTGLTCGTTNTLFVWAYNACGNSNVLTLTQNTGDCPWTCGASSLTDSRDANTYTTVQIGEQCWMGENLRYLPAVSPPANGSETAAHYYVYSYEGTDVAAAKQSTYYSLYGVLYNLPATMNGQESSNLNPSGVQGICPAGWHLPSDTEWKQTEMFLGMTQAQADGTGWRGTDEGGKLKSARTQPIAHPRWNTPNEGANNSSGFSAYPGGSRGNAGTFSYLGQMGYWWSTTESSGNFLARNISYGFATTGRNPFSKQYGLSVRCIKDIPCTQAPASPTSGTHTPDQTQILWDWNAVTGASGYKWNTVNSYATATDLGNITTLSRTGLNCGTGYTLYVWAYNNCGISNVSILTQNTNTCVFTCGTSNVSFTYNGANVTYGTVEGANNQCWLDRNLGAIQVATSSTDYLAYGDLFQWGRGADGHQLITWINATTGTPVNGTTSTLSNTDQPGHSNFIRTSVFPFDWRNPQNTNLWQGVSGINNPCPTDWRIPTIDELTDEYTSWSLQNSAGAFASPLKLPTGGARLSDNGLLLSIGSNGNYWSFSTYDITSKLLSFNNLNASVLNGAHGIAHSVRCIKDIPCTQSPTSPTSSTNLPSQTQIVWNWNKITGVNGLNGYKYNTVNNYTTSINNGSSTSFVQTGLNCGTSYTLYVWAYNDCGYSNVLTMTQSTSTCPFVCGNSFIDSRDNSTYTTVQIGQQCWLKENLKYLPIVHNNTQFETQGSNALPGYGVYDYNGSIVNTAKSQPNFTTYGVLYNWYAANTACPVTWHLPTLTEANDMEVYLIQNGYNYDGTTVVDKTAKSLGATTGWYNSSVTGAIGNTDYPLKRNSTGFTALPGGVRGQDGSFSNINLSGLYWLNTPSGDLEYGFRLSYNAVNKISITQNKSVGYSVRCILTE